MKNNGKWEREADKYKKKDATFSDKLSNFWDYHKYHVLIAVVSVVVLVYLSTSVLLKEKYDYEIICVLQDPVISAENGDYLSEDDTDIHLYKEDADYIQAYLESIGEDLNEDGKVSVSVSFINIEGDRVTATEIQTHKEQILTALRTGECMILLGDSVGMEFLSEADALEDISYLSENSEYNNRAICLNDFFKEKIGRGEADIQIYIGLRNFTGTLAQMSDEKSKDFNNAENLIKNILS